MNHSLGHDRLQNRYRISGKLLLDTPLRLSSGRASEQTDAPLMRLFDDTPVIPGSSLRGAIRSELERIVAAVDLGAGIHGCILFSDDDCAALFRKHQQNKKAELTDKEIVEYAQNSKQLCSICRLFGTTFFASRLIIEDAVAQDDYQSRTRIRDGVGIDRDTGAARETIKFDYEVLESRPSGAGTDVSFGFAMQVENLADQDKTLIGIVLALLKQGIHVGGKRAAGLGRIRLDDGYEIHGFSSPAELWQRLQAGKDLYQTFPRWEEVPAC